MTPNSKNIVDEADVKHTDHSDAIASSDISDDEDLRRAIALSLETEAITSSSANPNGNDSYTLDQPRVVSNTISGFLGIDRRKQEQERLMRLKRKRDGTISPPQLKRQVVGRHVAVNGNANSTHYVPSLLQPPHNPANTGNHAPSTSTPPISALQYPNGIVKQTWAFGYPRTGNDIKIEEILQSSALKVAVFSAFQWDFDWLFPKVNTKATSFVLIMQAKYESQQRQLRSDFDSIPNVRLCFPSMDGQINCMHSKLMLLFYQEYMRVVVPTGNLRPHDWGENGGIMENTVFLIDLPKSNIATTAAQNPRFAQDLLYFLKAQGLPEDVVQRVQKHDFSRTTDLGFVHTIGGVHTGDSWMLTGHCGLGRAIAGLGLSSQNTIDVDYVTSSVGSLNEEFLRSMYLAAQGDDGHSEYTLRTSKSFPAKCADDPSRIIKKDAGAAWKSRFRYYYPSEATVRASKGGPESAGTICFQEKWWNGVKFPRSNMQDCVSRRTGLLMHNKFLFARFPEPVSVGDGKAYAGWAYCGSANLSESAWGKLIQDKITKKPKLNCRNWECGVIIPLSLAEASPNLSKVVCRPPSGLEIFDPRIPVPMQGPARPMQGRKPWFNDG